MCLTGFPDAIQIVYPKTDVQLCIVHQIRNSVKYVGSKNQKEFLSDLKLVYGASTSETGSILCDKFNVFMYLFGKMKLNSYLCRAKKERDGLRHQRFLVRQHDTVQLTYPRTP